MDPQSVFCPNPDCMARGQSGKGNIGVHSQEEGRYICHTCGETFVETKGTPFYRMRKPHELIVIVVTLLAHGCPVQAIVQAFGWDERTVRRLQKQAGQHCQEVHEHLVEQPRDLGQVQADEIRVRAQGMILWLAMAIQVSTRLWLGGVVGAHRDKHLVRRLIVHVRACALCRPLLFCVDGFSAYVSTIHHVFREPIHTGQPGRPRLRPWDGLHIAQVIKRYAKGRVVSVQRRIVQGTTTAIQVLIQHTQGGAARSTPPTSSVSMVPAAPVWRPWSDEDVPWPASSLHWTLPSI